MPSREEWQEGEVSSVMDDATVKYIDGSMFNGCSRSGVYDDDLQVFLLVSIQLDFIQKY